MGAESIDRSQTDDQRGRDQRTEEQRRFLTILPLTIAIAGLPEIEHGRHLTEGQMEARGTSLRAAYKIAKQVLLDIGR
jgi:hypothetical protein